MITTGMGRLSAKEVREYIQARIAKWKERTGEEFPVNIDWDNTEQAWLLGVVCRWGYEAHEGEKA